METIDVLAQELCIPASKAASLFEAGLKQKAQWSEGSKKYSECLGDVALMIEKLQTAHHPNAMDTDLYDACKRWAGGDGGN